MAQLPRRYVAAPAPAPLPFGLLSAALVIDDDDAHLGGGVEYESLACVNTHSTVAACIDDTPDQLTSDDGVGVVHGDPFVVYALHQCRMVGSPGDMRGRARQILATGDWRGIEEAFQAATLPNADDVTPVAGTPVDPIDGLAILEEHAAQVYSGVPVIHGSRRLGTILASRYGIHRYNSRLETCQGAVFAGGGGYYDTGAGAGAVGGTTAGNGERWMWVTGAVVVTRGPIQTTDPVQSQNVTSDEVQTITEGGAGLTSFTLTFDGETTASIDDDATAGQVQAALEALGNITPGDVVVTGGPLGTGPMTVTFGGAYANTDVPQMTATPTGGTGTVTVATQAAGGGAPRQYTNEFQVLAQRVATVTFECINAAVLVRETVERP